MIEHLKTFSRREVAKEPQQPRDRKKKIDGALVRAAQYLRMSTEHQKYSTQNQSDTNHAYAVVRAMTIVRTYADEGKSGLTADKRDALRQLITDVQSGCADFEVILVYDVSRWGRFQDTDESAYYEYICKRAGISVHYCAEQFDNDGSFLAAILKAIRRSMAAEYSRDLSIKVFAGKTRLVKLGFFQGGPAGFGLRRFIVDQNNSPKHKLEAGERKNITSDRVILAPGPPHEVETVRWIFYAMAYEGKNVKQIADNLNKRAIPNSLGRPWSQTLIRKILKSERYVGNNVWNQHSFKLQKAHLLNPPEMWLRANGVFEGLIEPKLFERVQLALRTNGVPHGHPRKYTDSQLLKSLRRLYRERGYLSSYMLDLYALQSSTTYRARFETLEKAYQLVGFDLREYRKQKKIRPAGPVVLSNDEMLAGLRKLLRRHGRISSALIARTKTIPSPTAYHDRFGRLTRAYELIGYTPDFRVRPRNLSNVEMLNLLTALWKKEGYLSVRLVVQSPDLPSHTAYHRRFGGFREAYRLIGYSRPQS